ncbi:MAG: transporter substrate-binding domain-containing protein [Magnetococcales bacterium]|nr:transporter substrate-binding domain-containing protein [Magnetococcales bacterium]
MTILRWLGPFLGFLVWVGLLPPAAVAEPPGGEGALSESRMVVAVPSNLFAKTDGGRPSGVIAELLDSVLKGMGFEPIYISMPVPEMPGAMESGVVGMASLAFKGMPGTEQLLFTDPFLTEYNVVLVPRKKEIPLVRVSDLQGLRLGGREGYRYPLLEKNPVVALEFFRSDGEMIRNLILGKLDAAVISGVSDIFALRNEGIMAQLDVLKVAVGSVPLGGAFAPGRMSPERLQEFNGRVAALKESPEWQEILARNGLADLVREWKVVEAD